MSEYFWLRSGYLDPDLEYATRNAVGAFPLTSSFNRRGRRKWWPLWFRNGGYWPGMTRCSFLVRSTGNKARRKNGPSASGDAAEAVPSVCLGQGGSLGTAPNLLIGK